MHEVLVNQLGSLSLPRKSVIRLTDRPDMTIDVYRRRKTTQLICVIVGQRPSALAVGVVRTFFVSSIISHFFLPLSGRRPDID